MKKLPTFLHPHGFSEKAKYFLVLNDHAVLGAFFPLCLGLTISVPLLAGCTVLEFSGMVGPQQVCLWATGQEYTCDAGLLGRPSICFVHGGTQ